jgi:hypothetical protein
MDDPVVGMAGVSTPAWLQASDVIVGEHRSVLRARRWLAGIHRRYPGCVVAVARHPGGRWCLLGLRTHTVVVRGGRLDADAAAGLGYHLFLEGARR